MPSADPPRVAGTPRGAGRPRGPRLSSPSVRSLRWAIAALSIAALAVVGWTVGLAATDRPHTSLGGERDRIQVWVTDPEAVLTLKWWMGPAGRVDLVLSLDHPATTTAKVIVLLQCNARLGAFEDLSTRVNVLSEETVGKPEACDHRQGDDRQASVQIITFIFRDAEDGLSTKAKLQGTPQAPWTDEAAGERVSRAPFVYVGGATRNAYFDEEFLHEPLRAIVTSTLASRQSEVLESHFPAVMAPRVGMTGEIFSGDDQSQYALGPAVSWRSNWSAEEMRAGGWRSPFYHHTSATAQWSDAAAVARAQQWLLLSGVFLGIVGSVVIEGLFTWAARRSRSSNRSFASSEAE